MLYGTHPVLVQYEVLLEKRASKQTYTRISFIAHLTPIV